MKPHNSIQVGIMVNALIRQWEIISGDIDKDKNLGVFVDEVFNFDRETHDYKITLAFIARLGKVSIDGPNHDIEGEEGKAVIIWNPYDDLDPLINSLHYELEEIKAFKL